jgi:hypothetical protein
MADKPQTVSDGGRRSGFMRELSTAAAKKALAPLAATAATAGTVYATRKSTEIWQERLLPKIRERGGGKAVARETLEKVADRIGGRGAEAFSGLAKRLGDNPSEDRLRAEPQAAVQQSTGQQPNGRREEERKKRQQRRQQRQRALEQSGST